MFLIIGAKIIILIHSACPDVIQFIFQQVVYYRMTYGNAGDEKQSFTYYKLHSPFTIFEII